VTPIIWSPQALLDLESIRAYIAHDSPRYAKLVVRRLAMAVERLGMFPESGLRWTSRFVMRLEHNHEW